MDYLGRFERNRGVLTASQQQRLKDARVLVVGTGGIGGTAALALARAGVGHFTLVDFDAFELSNLNRQMVCHEGTLGQNKAAATAAAIFGINPQATVEVLQEVVPLTEMNGLVGGHDLVFPAADDFAYSIMIFRACMRSGIPAVLAVPSGLWAMVSVLAPQGPTLERLLGLPEGLDYDGLRPLFHDPFYRLASFFYVLAAGWRREYQREFVDQGAPLAQLAPVVWSAGSLAALEGVKVLTGVGRVVAAPRYLWLSGRGVRVERFPGPTLHTAMVVHRRLSLGLVNSPLGRTVRKIAWSLYRR
jgi:molybdopterin/thiamine biosynthesis adenylyltransferase